MVDIEPYQYQKVTNIKEHNDIVAKINEIVDVINNTNLDTIIPRIDKIETDITGINSTDALQWQDIESVKGDIDTITPKITKLEQDVTDINSTDAVQNTDISNLKAKDSEQDNRLGSVDTEIDGITKSLVSDVAILNGTTSGNVKVRIGRQDAPSIDSDDYNIQKPTSVELIQGSAPAMVKAQITLSDGTVLISDDFMFTTEAIGQDVYISSFVFKNGNVAGSISADIGLSNGSTLTANNFVVPTDPNVTTAITDLQTRLTTVENTGVTDINGLKTTVSEHTSEINTLKSDVAGLTTDKADVNNNEQTITAGTINATNINKNGVAVATVNDIPSVPDISGKADLNNPTQTIVARNVNATGISGVNISKGGVAVATVNDIPDISGKVDKAQGVSNAGKVLGIGSDGNVTPVEVSSGGENWEELNLSNVPTNWADGDRFKICLKAYYDGSTDTVKTVNYPTSPVLEFIVPSYNYDNRFIYSTSAMSTDGISVSMIRQVFKSTLFNNGRYMSIGGELSSGSVEINSSNIATYVYKMWRLKK